MDEGCVGLEQQFEGELQLPGDGGRAADLADSDVGKRHAVGVVGGDGGVGIAEAGCEQVEGFRSEELHFSASWEEGWLRLSRRFG